MQIIVSMLFFVFAAWLASRFLLFIPLYLMGWFQNISWYFFLSFLIVAVSWLIGE